MEINEIKAEYIAGGLGVQPLAQKYGIPYGKLRRIAEREGWKELRTKCERKTDEEIAKSVSKKQARVARKITEIADKLLVKIDNALNNADSIGPQSAKDYATALKRIQEIDGIKSDLDTREQEARIKRLEMDANSGGENRDTGVLILPAISEVPVPPTEDDYGE